MSAKTEKAVFFRIDDVFELNARLKRVVIIFLRERIPIHLAVIPDKLTKNCATWLRHIKNEYPELIEIGQHGFRHRNWGDKNFKYEFGPRRTFVQQRHDILRGRVIMEREFGEKLSWVFVPPYHGYNNNTLRSLSALGFQIFSHRVDAPYIGCKYDLKDISIVIDFNRLAYLINSDIMEKQLSKAESNRSFIGILLHPQTFTNNAQFTKLEALIDKLKSRKYKFMNIQSIISRDSASIKSSRYTGGFS